MEESLDLLALAETLDISERFARLAPLTCLSPSITSAISPAASAKIILDHYQQTKNLPESYSPKALGFF